MKRKTKILISALSVMFVAAIAVAIASFSFAGDKDKDALQEGTEMVADASAGVDSKTIIDYIIENSNSVDEDVDKIYHIAEITSSGTPSSLSTFVSSNGFKNYVIDGNRTIEQAMADGCVEYKSFNGSLNAEKDSDAYNKALIYISKADLIYVSNDGNNAFSKSNDLTEDLYDVLHEYAVGSFKPLIIDNPNASKIDDPSKSMSMNDLAKSVFGPNEKYYYTFKWADGVTASQYLQHANGSLYLGINGKTQKENGRWDTVYETNAGIITPEATGTDPTAPAQPMSLAKILTISTDGSSTRTNDLLAGNDAAGTLYDDAGTPITVSTNQRYFKLKADSIFSLNGYNNRVGIKPTYIRNDIVTLADSATVDFDQYDMIVIEDSCIGQSITSDLYKKFASAMYGKLHIVYSTKMGTGSATTGSTSDTEKRDSNFMKLMMMVATTEYIAKTDNILVTTRSEFSVITTSTSAETAKIIADLINASKYRGIGGNSSSSSMFTVLELQPCYPIDLELAQSKEGNTQFYSGSYYTDPSSMIDGKTKEQLPENTEYYAWELSKAKLADALGIPYNKINLVQMSAEEFAGDKTEILGTYDMIYLGGNMTALKDSARYFKMLQNQNIGQEWSGHQNLNQELLKLPIYTMYSHNTDLVPVCASDNQNFQGSKLTAQVSKNGNLVNTFTPLNGNDITYNRYLSMKEYIDKGMPVVISSKLTAAYELARDDGYMQNSLDPDSNMFKVLAACEAKKLAQKKKNAAVSVAFNFLQDKVVDVFDDGSLGDSMTGYVSIFASEEGSISESDTATSPATITGSKEVLLRTYNNAKKRPKLIIKSMPTAYNRFDESTLLDSKTLSFKYDVVGSQNYTATLYVDDNGNSKFDRDPSGKEYLVSSNSGSLSYDCPESFFGSVYWMLEVVDNDTGIAVNQTGFSYIKNSENTKQQVNILQIMPDGGGGSTGNDSLYFCTVCQRSTQILNYNPAYGEDASRHRHVVEYEGGYKDTASSHGVLSNGVYIGKHQHIFGVNAYDSNLKLENYQGVDDFYKNLADEVDNLYDFDIDIIRSSEFESWSQQVHDAYSYVIDTNGNITDTVITIDRMRQEVTAGPSLDSPNIEDYNLLLNELLTKANVVNVADLTDADIKLLYIQKKKCDFSFIANDYQLLYQQAVGNADTARENLEEAFDEMIANFNGSNGPFAGNTTKKELQDIRHSGYYFDLYALGSRVALRQNVSSAYLTGGKDINKLISDYYHALDGVVDNNKLFKQFTRLAAGSEWMGACYSTVLLGPSEGFNGKDITNQGALDDLEKYISDGHQVVLFHDTLSAYSDKGASTLTARLRGYFGMDRYNSKSTIDAAAAEAGAVTNNSNPKIDDSESNYVQYTSQDENKYFMTNLSWKPRNDVNRYGTWTNDVGIWTDRYLTNVAYTDSFNLGNDGDKAKYAMPYKYAKLKYSDQTVQIQDAKFDINTFYGKYGTNKASRNNMGLVTTFPFTIASELNIGPTHGQVYAVDLEDDDMTVWYSLAGGDSGPSVSSIFAASPRDAMDNYFLYSYKNVFYCGAGHGDILGIHKNNNDERYLFINIMCNSVRLSIAQPKINIFDYDPTEEKTENKIIKQEDNAGYVMKVKGDNVYPEFNFKVTTDKDTTLTNVKIFYDLDYEKNGNKSNAFVPNSNTHILIADWGSEQITRGQNKHVFRYDASLEKLAGPDGHQIMETYVKDNGETIQVAATKLKLLPSYFAPYNDDYTYIVIEATDSKGQKVHQRLKIKKIPYLFDLT